MDSGYHRQSAVPAGSSTRLLSRSRPRATRLLRRAKPWRTASVECCRCARADRETSATGVAPGRPGGQRPVREPQSRPRSGTGGRGPTSPDVSAAHLIDDRKEHAEAIEHNQASPRPLRRIEGAWCWPCRSSNNTQLRQCSSRPSGPCGAKGKAQPRRARGPTGLLGDSSEKPKQRWASEGMIGLALQRAHPKVVSCRDSAGRRPGGGGEGGDSRGGRPETAPPQS
jgi:hypothetical protein